MIGDDDRLDPVLEALGSAAVADLDAHAAERLRARCHRALVGQLDRAGGGAGPRRSAHLLEPALVVGSSAIYLVEVLRRAGHLLGP